MPGNHRNSDFKFSPKLRLKLKPRTILELHVSFNHIQTLSITSNNISNLNSILTVALAPAQVRFWA